MLGRLCLGAMLIGQRLTKSTRHSMSYILLLSRLVLSRPLSSETLVWLLSAVAYSDSSTMSQAELPLEQIHAFYWEMGPFTTLIFPLNKAQQLSSSAKNLSLEQLINAVKK